MPQRLILDKFIQYLYVREPLLTANLQQEFPDNNRDKVIALHSHLTALRDSLIDGHCFGFAVVHAAMDETGKLQWWEKTLETIANWDESPGSLEEFIELSDAEADAYWQTNAEKNKPDESTTPNAKTRIKLKTLFERALDYIVSNQDSDRIRGLTQTTLLSPHTDFFELLHDGEIKKIKARKIIAGNFSPAELISLLNEEDFTNGINLLHTPEHTVRIYIKEGKWHIYNPNYDHTNIHNFHKCFDNKLELVAEIISKLGTSLGIEIASFDNLKNISLPDLFSLGVGAKEIVTRIEGYGLDMIAHLTPEHLCNVLDLAAKTEEGKDAIIRAITTTSPVSKWNGLHTIACYAPNDLTKVLNLAAETEKGKAAIATAITAATTRSETGFIMIVLFAPSVLPKIFAIAQQNPREWSSRIAWVLNVEQKNKWTGLHTLTYYAPSALLPYLELAAQSEEGMAAIAKTLVAVNKTNWTGLHAVAMYAPDALTRFLELAAKTKEGLVAIADALAIQNKYGWTGLQIVAYYAPQCLPLLLNSAAQTQHGLMNIAKAISATTTQEFNTDRNSKPDALKIMPDFSGLQMVARFAPNSLNELIMLGANTDEGLQAIQQTKILEISEGVTCLDAIRQFAPFAYEKITKPSPTHTAKHSLQFILNPPKENTTNNPQLKNKKMKFG